MWGLIVRGYNLCRNCPWDVNLIEAHGLTFGGGLLSDGFLQMRFGRAYFGFGGGRLDGIR